jgi:predicted P-loop ATPase
VTNIHTPENLCNDQHTFALTFFDSPQAPRKWQTTTSLADLRERILETSKAAKDKLPWLKLATFGDKKTAKGSLRNDNNVLAITGIELDYDEKQIPFADAVETCFAHGLKCLLYTSPSYTEAAPKWRILCPTSAPLPPAERERLARGVDEIFSNVFATESFTLSQAFYYGKVGDNPGHQCVIVDGDFVDEIALPAPKKKAKAGNGKANGHDQNDYGKHIANVLSGDVIHTELRDLAAALIGAGTSPRVAIDMLNAIIDNSVKRQTEPAVWEHRRGQIPMLVDTAIAKYRNPDNLQWAGCHKDGSPVPNMANAQLAIETSGVTCSYNTFHNKRLIDYRGEVHELQHLLGEVTDSVVIGLRKALRNQFGTDFGDKHIRDALTSIGDEHRFDPVCDMLDQAQAAWDGTERLDNMAVDYANCEDTPLNRAIMRKTIIAAVRRARRPGCKFDNITVLESDEGWNKSTFWRVLAGDQNFSDESILGKSGREIQEHLSEVWIHESADLAGMRKAEREQIKAFASRQVDIARPAYGYFIKRQPRHAINVGTTNSDEYLESQTGNRRFWPLKVLKRIDTKKLERDRLQLWGEAAACEAKGEEITLPENLWGAAADEQEKRRVKEPWESKLADIPRTISAFDQGKYGTPCTVTVIHELGEIEFARSTDLLTYVLQISIDRQDRLHEMRLSDAMKRLGWARHRAMLDNVRHRGWARPLANLANQPKLRLASKN